MKEIHHTDKNKKDTKVKDHTSTKKHCKTILLQDICHEQYPNKGHRNILSPLQSFEPSVPTRYVPVRCHGS